MSYKKIEKQDLTSEKEKHIEKALIQLESIVTMLPLALKDLIEQAFIHQRIPKEYLLSSILFAYSNAAGLAFNLKHRSFVNYCNLYFALIGSRGDLKSPAMSLATAPLNKFDDEEYEDYEKKQRDAEALDSSENEKQEIKRKQLLIQNATIEAAMYAHLKNPYSIGIYIDEIKYLIEKMANKNNNEGQVWRTFLLQGSTNQHIDISRKTTDSYRMKKSYPTLLGSIQTQFVPNMFANGNLESGFIDRILFVTKLTNNNKLSKTEFPKQVIDNYNKSLTSVLDYRSAIEKSCDSLAIVFSTEAEIEMHNYVQQLINLQSTLPDKEKEYNSKMQISIYKITLLLHLIFNSANNSFQSKITLDIVKLGILLNEFYYTNFKIVISTMKTAMTDKAFLHEAINRAIKNGATQSDIVKLTGLSKGYISKQWNK